jgi:predicted Zn finger-like uncharacterized protein
MQLVQITCPFCNYSKEIPSDKLPVHSVKVTCPKCKQGFDFNLPPLVAEFTFENMPKIASALPYPNSPPPLSVDNSITVPCQFCKEIIHSEAVKCKHCGSILNKIENMETNSSLNQSQQLGYSATREVPLPNGAKGKIKIKRTSRWMGKFNSYKVMIDGVMVAQIRNGGEFDCFLYPGKHELQVSGGWMCRSNILQFDNSSGIPLSFECMNRLSIGKLALICGLCPILIVFWMGNRAIKLFETPYV